MVLKQTTTGTVNKQTGIPSNSPRCVLEIDTKEFFKDNGANYFSVYKGTFAYFFDDPSRKHNMVLIRYGKNKTKILKINEFMFHLVLWRANVTIMRELKIDDRDFYNLTNPTNKTINHILDDTVRKLVEYENDVSPRICDCISSIKEDLSSIAYGYSPIKCDTISIYDIIQFKKRNKKFRDLLNTRLDKTKPIKDLEIEMKQCEKDLINTVMTDKRSQMYPYLCSGRIKSAQLTKILCAVGTRPDIDKTILPWPIERGYIHGLSNMAEYFMETITARDAMLTKNDNVPRSGFLSREINRLTSSVNINYDVEDCGTKNYLNYTVENQDYLEMAEGSYYLDEDSGKLKELSPKNTTLIGKTIKLRSFIGCACKEGVCKTCVGKVSIRLRGTRLGTLPAIKSINPLSQKSMSAKHDTGTKSIAITNEALIKYFDSDGADFYLKPEFVPNAKNMAIVINSDDVEEIMNSSNIDVEDSTIDTHVQLSYVALRDNGIDYPIENEGMRIALVDEIVKTKNVFQEDPEDQEFVTIPLSKIECESPIFSIILDTEEISKYLNSFIGVIDRISISRFKTYDELMAEMNKIIYESGFVNKMIHFETIVYNLIRDANDPTIRPDMSIPNVPYQILKVSTAIEMKDMYTAIAFQGLRRLFKTLSIRKRYGQSLYDPFFRISKLY